MIEFENLTHQGQVRRLRKLAIEALKEFPFKKYELKFINHGENTTFKVITKKKSYLLRVHRGGYHTKSAILEEIRWVESLGKKTSIDVQTPIRSKKGQFVVITKIEGVPEPRYCDMFEWRDGRIEPKNLGEKHFFNLGLLTAKLHTSTEGKKSKHRNYWTVEGLIGKSAQMGSFDGMKAEFPKEYVVLNSCRKKLMKKIKAYQKSRPQKFGLIHADMHFGNLLWKKGEPIPIDFDDSGFGAYAYDMAVTLGDIDYFYDGKVDKKKGAELREAYFSGYRSLKSLDEKDILMIDVYWMVRRLTMIGWVYNRKDNPSLREHFKKTFAKRMSYFRKIDKKL